MHLTTWEREHIRINVNALRGLSVAKLRNALRILNAVELSAEEQKQVGYETTDDGARWAKDGYAADVSFTDDERELVRGVVETTVKIQALNGSFGVAQSQRLMRLCAKLDLDFWDIVDRAEEELAKRQADTAGQDADGEGEGPADSADDA